MINDDAFLVGYIICELYLRFNNFKKMRNLVIS